MPKKTALPRDPVTGRYLTRTTPLPVSKGGTGKGVATKTATPPPTPPKSTRTTTATPEPPSRPTSGKKP